MNARGMGRVYQRGGVFWIEFWHRGAQCRESSHSAKRGVAVDLLKQRHRELAHGRLPDEAQKLLLSGLRALIGADYIAGKRRSIRRVDGAWKHLEAFFGKDEPVVSITAPRLAAYVTSRRQAGAAAATLRNELSAFRRGLRLAREGGALYANEGPAAVPKIKPGSPRKGFLERGEHEAIRRALPPDEGDVAEFLFWTGWRRTEATGLRWGDVDEEAKVIRIETTKTDEPRTLPYGSLPQLAGLIEHRREVTDAVQRTRDMVAPFVFHRNGDRIVTFYRSWAGACVAAGFGHEIRKPDVLDGEGKVLRRGRLIRRVIHRIPHDYRRSAARNFSRAGVPERVIMELCGWKTRSVFDRYRIVAEQDLRDGLARLADAAPAAEAPKVASIGARRPGEPAQNPHKGRRSGRLSSR